MKSFTLKNTNNIISTIKEEDKDLRREDISKRSTFAKHFINDDGSYTMEISPFPVHYYDYSKKTYEEIDNSMVENDGKFSIMRNKMKLIFNKEIEVDKPLFSLENDGHSFQLFYLGKKGNVEKTILKKTTATTKHISKQISNLTYENVASGIDLEYSVQFNQIKENIIVKEKQDNYEFSFLVDIGDLTAQLSEDESRIELVDKHQKVQYTIPSPIMFDSNNCESTDLGYEIETTKDGKLVFTLKANADWINSPDRVFPVTIDPQVEIVVDVDENMVKHYQVTNNTAQIPSLKFISLNNSSSPRSYLLVINLKELPPFANVSEASLTFDFLNDITNSMNLASYDYKITSADELPSSFSIVTNNMESYKLYKFSSKNELIHIEDIIKNWIGNRKTSGALLFKINDTISTSCAFWYPTLTIKYILENGLPSSYTNLKNNYITEIVSDYEVELINATGKSGILITIVDSKNNIVYQTLRINNQIYTRNSTDHDTWTEWKKNSMRAEFIDGILYLTDEN